MTDEKKDQLYILLEEYQQEIDKDPDMQDWAKEQLWKFIRLILEELR